MSDPAKNDPEAQEAMLGGNVADLPPADHTNEETACGIWFISGEFLQKFANKKAFILLNGILGLIMTASYTYSGGTISTIEKRFKLDSKTTGFINVGNDISTLMFGALITYYAGKQGHKPRWIAMGVYTVVLFCALNAVPHFVYGPGEDALVLTTEYGGSYINSSVTKDIQAKHNKKILCRKEELISENDACKTEEGTTGPVVILFAAQFISGLGGSLYYTLGTTYLDDNIKKSKTPALMSLTYFIRMLGPAIGSSLSAYCLSLYISPGLHPKIDNRDPRWLGAWWLGWTVLAVAMFIMASIVALFPRQLPRAYVRRLHSQMSQKGEPQQPDTKASIKDFFITTKRLLSNKIWFCNTAAGLFYIIGYTPFWTFGAKYTEFMFKMSAAKASFVTGTIGLGFSAVGLLASGLVISKYKPSARKMAAWNVFVSLTTAAGLISYSFLGCVDHDQKLEEGSNELQTNFECNEGCNCEYAKYSPVCSYGETFISPCHAGCTDFMTFPNGTKVFTDCSCTKNQTAAGDPLPRIAHPGPCPPGPSCTTSFYIYLAIKCFLKFVGATGRATNLLVAIRCVDEKDKPTSMGLGSFIISLLAFIPSPIIFGYIIDTTCLVWGRTCTGKGNCWLYNGLMLRDVLTYSASVFILIGTMFDTGVWYYVKDLNCFDEEEEEEPVKPEQNGKELKEFTKRPSNNEKGNGKK